MTETTPEGIVNPPIDQLLEHVDSKYRLVLFAAKRARQINAYYSQLAEGLLENVGPLVETTNQPIPTLPLTATYSDRRQATAAARMLSARPRTAGVQQRLKFGPWIIGP